MSWNFCKTLALFLVVSTSVFIFSCDDDDTGPAGETNPLVGTWNVTELVASTAIQEITADVSGTIKFNADGTGQESYSWTALGVTVQESNGFTWESSSSTITFDPGDVDQTIWSRLVNEADRQRGSYESVIDGQDVTIMITLTK